jgi:hypothetical protein
MSFSDRPGTISGLSESSYAVPFSYRALMSGGPQLCSSLVSDGFDGEPPDRKTRLYAISSDFELGFARLKKFFTLVRTLVGAPALIHAIEETHLFLDAHRDRYTLLETIELDTMSEGTDPGARTAAAADSALWGLGARVSPNHQLIEHIRR